MSLTALAFTRGSLTSRRGAVAIVGLSLAAALSLATLSNTWLGQAVHQGIDQSLHGVETVAAMLAERSPGTRSVGELALLKHKREAVLHERALPKIRGPYVPPTAYEALASPPPAAAIAPPPQAPLFATVAGPPEVIPPVGGVPGGSFGPPVFSNIPSPGGGGGGGGFTPPIITTVTPQVPVTPAAPVPEPASWGMMLLGFGLMGAVLRRRTSAGLQPAPE